MQLKRVAEAKLPTPWGDFLMKLTRGTKNR